MSEISLFKPFQTFLHKTTIFDLALFFFIETDQRLDSFKEDSERDHDEFILLLFIGWNCYLKRKKKSCPIIDTVYYQNGGKSIKSRAKCKNMLKSYSKKKETKITAFATILWEMASFPNILCIPFTIKTNVKLEEIALKLAYIYNSSWLKMTFRWLCFAIVVVVVFSFSIAVFLLPMLFIMVISITYFLCFDFSICFLFTYESFICIFIVLWAMQFTSISASIQHRMEWNGMHSKLSYLCFICSTLNFIF